MNIGTPHPSRNEGKILKSHGIERVKAISPVIVNLATKNKK